MTTAPPRAHEVAQVLRSGNVRSADGWHAVLKRVIPLSKYPGTVTCLYFRGDAAFGNPEITNSSKPRGSTRSAASSSAPVGLPPHELRRYYASFHYQAQSWTQPRRVVAKVEWHPGELYPRVGLIVTNLARPAERVVAFHNR